MITAQKVKELAIELAARHQKLAEDLRELEAHLRELQEVRSSTHGRFREFCLAEAEALDSSRLLFVLLAATLGFEAPKPDVPGGRG